MGEPPAWLLVQEHFPRDAGGILAASTLVFLLISSRSLYAVGDLLVAVPFALKIAQND